MKNTFEMDIIENHNNVPEVEDIKVTNPPMYVVTKISEMFKDKEYGFDIFVVMKTEPKMKRFLFYEGKRDNFKTKIEESISKAIKEKFLSDDSQYTMAEQVADDQNKFYLIKQSDSYRPMEFLKISECSMDNFSVIERDNAEALVFRFAREKEIIWAYQYIAPTNIPNKKRENFLTRCFSTEQQDRFVEMDDLLFPITQKINLVVFDDYIVTKDISLMQRHFGFEDFVRGTARSVVSDISAIGLVANNDKLIEYIERKKTKYAKKMMRIKTFNVINKSAEELLQKVTTVQRWQGVFDTTNGKINLHTYQDVENLIDFFDERFTKSLITDDEFDTDVKSLAIPIIDNDK